MLMQVENVVYLYLGKFDELIGHKKALRTQSVRL